MHNKNDSHTTRINLKILWNLYAHESGWRDEQLLLTLLTYLL